MQIPFCDLTDVVAGPSKDKNGLVLIFVHDRFQYSVGLNVLSRLDLPHGVNMGPEKGEREAYVNPELA